MQTCVKCEQLLDNENFKKKRKIKGVDQGLYTWCKACCEKEFGEENRVRKEMDAEHRAKYREESREAMRVSKYGMDNELYETVMQFQDQNCAICTKPRPEEHEPQFHIDHDHNTNTVRGILCSNCNVGLGNFMDNTEILRSAIIYLEINKKLMAQANIVFPTINEAKKKFYNGDENWIDMTTEPSSDDVAE